MSAVVAVGRRSLRSVLSPSAVAASRPLRICGLIAGLLAFTAALLIWTPALTVVSPMNIGVPWWAMVLLFAGAEMVVLHIQIQREAQTVSLSEIPLVIGLFLANPLGLLIGRTLGSFLVFTLHRRQAPIKVAYNTALVLASGTLALAMWSLAGGGRELGAAAWAAAYAGVVAAGAFDAAVTTVAIACYEGGLKIRQVLHEVASAGLLAAAFGTVGLVAATSIAAQPESALLVGAAGGLLMLGYRAYASLRERHESLEQLYHFSEVVSGAHDVDTVLRSVLSQARQLLRSDRAEFLALAFPGGLAPHRLTLLPDGVERAALEDLATDPVAERVVLQRRSILIARHTKDPNMRAYLDERGLREAIVVPLHMDGTVVGTLSVGNRLGEVRGFDQGDVRLLETVANHAGVALKSGSLIARLSYEAHHDSLTALPNRQLLQQELDAAIGAVRMGTSVGCAVMISDLNGFKEVNDTLGHQHGDELLRKVAYRFVAEAGERATVARLGGDEFAVLLTDVSDPAEALALAERLVASLLRPMRVDGVSVDVSASVGVAMAPLHAEDVSGLLKRADVAMYAAKANGGGVRVYDEGLQEAANPSRLALVGELRAAIRDGGIEAWVQPKASLRDGAVFGVEALARWRHPVDGIRMPADFLPVAESNGMIAPLTEAMLDSALAACAAWRTQGIEAGVAVNVSPRSLKDRSFLDTVAAALARHDVPARMLTIEITETSLMADSPQAVDLLCRLNALGVRLSIDDFGTGYSSLAYLRRLPVSEVKIDREFTSRIATDPKVLMIVRSTWPATWAWRSSPRASRTRASGACCRSSAATRRRATTWAAPMPASEFPAWLAKHNAEFAERRGAHARSAAPAVTPELEAEPTIPGRRRRVHAA